MSLGLTKLTTLHEVVTLWYQSAIPKLGKSQLDFDKWAESPFCPILNRQLVDLPHKLQKTQQPAKNIGADHIYE